MIAPRNDHSNSDRSSTYERMGLFCAIIYGRYGVVCRRPYTSATARSLVRCRYNPWPIPGDASTARSTCVSRVASLQATRREIIVVVIGERHSPARARGHPTVHTGSLEDDCCASAAKDLTNASALVHLPVYGSLVKTRAPPSPIRSVLQRRVAVVEKHRKRPNAPIVDVI